MKKSGHVPQNIHREAFGLDHQHLLMAKSIPTIVLESLTSIFSRCEKNLRKQDYTFEHGYLVRTLASCPGVPGSNPIAARKSYEVYPGLGILQQRIAVLQ